MPWRRTTRLTSCIFRVPHRALFIPIESTCLRLSLSDRFRTLVAIALCSSYASSDAASTANELDDSNAGYLSTFHYIYGQRLLSLLVFKSFAQYGMKSPPVVFCIRDLRRSETVSVEHDMTNLQRSISKCEIISNRKLSQM
jgi:hypothetical protein